MKKALFYCFALIAMSFAFVLPAQALEGWEGFAPVADYASPVDIGEDSTPCLAVCIMPQLEAADIMASKSSQWPDGSGLAKNTNQTDAPSYAYFEVGWRIS
jgi:hypothetical protein